MTAISKETVNVFMPEDMMPDNIKHCPLCNGSSFTWGMARAGHKISFVPGESFLERLKVWADKKVEARCCNSCGNLQLFVQD